MLKNVYTPVIAIDLKKFSRKVVPAKDYGSERVPAFSMSFEELCY